MGAADFEARVNVPKTTTDSQAFDQAVSAARFENGHGGYSGTIAEKSSFVMIHHASCEENAKRMVHALLGGHTLPIYREELREIITDKWQAAAAIRFPVDKKTDGIIFFGMASC